MKHIFDVTVVGSSKALYQVRIGLGEGGLVMTCTCPFGLSGRGKRSLCKHRRSLLERDFMGLSVDGVESRRLDAWLDGHSAQVQAFLGAAAPTATAVPTPIRCATAPVRTVKVAPRRSAMRNLGVAACIDIETTGLAAQRDAVIEVAVGLFTYDRSSAEILGIHEIYSSLEEPSIPIPSEASAVNSISNDLCAGKAIDWDNVRRMITRADLLVAHNAEFERRFLSRMPGLIDGKLLLCTQHIPNWAGTGKKPSRRLEDLSSRYGVAHLAHRAFGDVIATISLLRLKSPTTGAPYFREILERAGQGSLLFPKRN